MTPSSKCAAELMTRRRNDMRIGSRKAKIRPGIGFGHPKQGLLDLGDGGHRYRAHVIAGRKEMAVEVRPGGKREARLLAAQANTHHGLPSTRNQAHRGAQILLLDPETRVLADREIARRTGASAPTVGRVEKPHL